uniref:Epoxyqueuosine reductase n=1 Tax=Curvibacter symbiont subsp. Hydra magnipapillata TaxID=667019 RepID=C9YGD6_CURXX|nr:Putative electron transport protein yjeS [Curvibacter putative symbiont of Hydra magnipapillata]
MAHQRSFAGPQIAMQRDEGMGQFGLCRPVRSESGGGGFICPHQHRGGGSAFYNGVVTINSTQIKAQFDGDHVVALMQGWARELGFSQIGVAGVDLSSAEAGLLAWLSHGFHGEMGYMAHHGLKRARPAELVPGTVSVITTRMDYLPMGTNDGWADVELARLQRPQEGIVSLYARGRDYHKVLRNRLQKLADQLSAHMGPLGYRVFTDSAPVLEAELAARSGQGWRGKHTLLLNREAGSMFFLGEIYVDVALPATAPTEAHCGSCNACITACPTQAIIAPHRLDARRCISYLTIEHDGPIPLELRPLIGNRIYGCDDCQLVCPWNKFARRSSLPDFDAREGLAGEALATLLDWTEDTFLKRTEGSPIRRIGHVRWLRNVAVAMGNALRSERLGDIERLTLVRSLQRRIHHPDPLVQEHVQWAMQAFQPVSPD